MRAIRALKLCWDGSSSDLSLEQGFHGSSSPWRFARHPVLEKAAETAGEHNVMRKAMRRLRNAIREAISQATGNEVCRACGFIGKRSKRRVLWPELVREWGLSNEWENYFEHREGRDCVRCGCSMRASHLAEAIVIAIKSYNGASAECLGRAFDDPRVTSLKIAEINSAGALHQFLKKSPNLRYSEYATSEPGVPSEDLLSLSYHSCQFDIVVTSETLEHVPDFTKALLEIRRVLKPNGKHVFTTPVVWDRAKTKKRASIINGNLVHHHTPSYHGKKQTNKQDYLVYYEYGSDIVALCEDCGFHVQLIRDATNPALVSFVTTKK